MSTSGWIVLAVVIVLAVASTVIAIRSLRSQKRPGTWQDEPVRGRPKTNENPILREVSTRPRYEQRLDEQLTAKRVPLPRSDTSEKKFQDKRNTALRRDDSIDMGGLSTSPMTPGHPLFPLTMGGTLGDDRSDRSNFPSDRGGDSNDSSSPSGGYESTPTPTTSSWSSSSGDGWGSHSSSHSSDHSGGYSGGSDSGGSFGGDSGGGFGGSE